MVSFEVLLQARGFWQGLPRWKLFFEIIKLLYISVVNDYISLKWFAYHSCWKPYVKRMWINDKPKAGKKFWMSGQWWDLTRNRFFWWSDWDSFLFMLQNWKNTWKITKAAVCCSRSFNLANPIKFVIAPFFQKVLKLLLSFLSIYIWHP